MKKTPLMLIAFFMMSCSKSPHLHNPATEPIVDTGSLLTVVDPITREQKSYRVNSPEEIQAIIQDLENEALDHIGPPL